jgi:hypothetical protein
MNSWITIAYAIPTRPASFPRAASWSSTDLSNGPVGRNSFSPRIRSAFPPYAGGTPDECFTSYICNVSTKHNAIWIFCHDLAGHAPCSSEPFPLLAPTSQRLWWGEHLFMHSAPVKPCLYLALVLGLLVLLCRDCLCFPVGDDKASSFLQRPPAKICGDWWGICRWIFHGLSGAPTP